MGKRKEDSAWSRLPDDWKPSAHLLAWATEKRPDLTPSEIQDETENFLEFWTNTQGTKAEKRDWDRAFQTWMRKANVRFRRAGYQPPSNGGLVV